MTTRYLRRIQALPTALFLAATALAGACSSENAATARADQGSSSTEKGNAVDGGSAGASRHLPCDVDAVLRSKCQACHGASPAAGASVPLVTHADLQRDYDGKKVYELVGARLHDDANPMPPKPNKLTPAELSTLDGWLAAGTPSSSAKCDLPETNAVNPLSCTPDVTLKSDGSFTMPSGVTDVYMCFGATVKVDKKRHVVGFAPHVNNPKIVHHILLFKSPTPVSSTPFVCSGVGSAVWQLVSGWAPGGTNLELPPEAGFPEEAGDTNWVLQVHYNDVSGKNVGEVDQSGYELCTTDQLRQYDAGVAGFGTIVIAMPPRSKYAVNCSWPATAEWAGKKFFNSIPHMHGRGTAMSTKLVHLSGETTVVSDQPDYDFNNQANFPVDATVQLGDSIQTRCAWKNTTDSVVTFGERTEDEMCFNFLSYYPAIPLYGWSTPSINPGCIPELSAAD